jgi:hypothetical protein
MKTNPAGSKISTYLFPPAFFLLILCSGCLTDGDLPLPGPEKKLFDFVIPWDDSSESVIDVARCVPSPAGENGFIVVTPDGHLADRKGRQRFWGVNTCFGANFPSHEDAEKIARHMAKFGITIVRFHHMDMFAAPDGIWETTSPDRILDTDQLDKLDYFIYQLKLNGIYSEMIPNYFDIDQNPVKCASFVPAAQAFLRYDIQPAKKQVSIPFSRDKELDLLLSARAWQLADASSCGIDSSAALLHSIRLMTDKGRHNPNDLTPADLDIPDTIFTSDTQEIVWDISEGNRGVFTVATERSIFITGFSGGKTYHFPGITIQPGNTLQDGFSCTGLTLIEGRSLERSGPFSHYRVGGRGQSEHNMVGVSGYCGPVSAGRGTAGHTETQQWSASFTGRGDSSSIYPRVWQQIGERMGTG